MTKQLRGWAQEILEENHGPPFSKLAEDISALLAECDRLREAAAEVVDEWRTNGSGGSYLEGAIEKLSAIFDENADSTTHPRGR